MAHSKVLKLGDKIPDFSCRDENDELITSEKLMGHRYILYFYPKDDTPGCTKEGCSIRDNYNQIRKKGYEVFGVSPDKVKKHQKFKSKYEFPFSLLADPEKKMIEAFGMWGKKKFMGREFFGVLRKTLVIDEEGRVLGRIDKVINKSAGEQLLKFIEEIEQVSVDQ